MKRPPKTSAFVRLRANLARLASALALAPVHAYRHLISPALPARCKYYPSCSRYAVDAVAELGVVRGSLVAAWRLARCNPWSNGGVDPIENRRFFRSCGHAHGAEPTQAPRSPEASA